MANYPKELSDALERDLGITIGKGKRGTSGDTRLAYGATCTWFGPIQEVGTKTEHRLPCCPLCGGVLFEMPTEQEWWDGIDKYERDGHPGYRALWEWQRKVKRCFPLRDGIKALEAAHKAALESASVVPDDKS